ncbi:DUF7345 domain-containing protein [Haloglomus litoreum]|uniref:DUF7345 domain-containing protein n=1 Tax=Haloglomus litoreum TaxID=3034026 RepID=UPI0023E79F9A|nr:hypothetical protein [Haloglomus sp. DT116]
MRRDWRAVLAACMLLSASLAAVPAGAVHDTDRQFTVDLAENGTATVTFERRYNLSVAAERDRFRTLANNTTALEQRRAAFGAQLRAEAANGSQRTAREMRIENVTVASREVNGTGVVEYRARWVALAGIYGAQVVVNEPFSTSFDPNATLVVRGPDGYVREQVSPPPAIARANVAFWGADTDLDGFSARFVDPDATTAGGDDDGDGDGESTPPPEPSGVGRVVGAAGFALVPALLVLLGARRRDLLEDPGSGADGDGASRAGAESERGDGASGGDGSGDDADSERGG